MLRLGRQKWELHRGPACGDCQPVSGLNDRFWARQWLQQFKGDALAIRAIRGLVSQGSTPGTLSRLGDDEVIAKLANLMGIGAWHVHPHAIYSDASPDAQAEPSPQAVSDAPSTTPKPVSVRPRSSEDVLTPDELSSLLPSNADEEAIIAAMREAAESGIPFCEECMRAALHG